MSARSLFFICIVLGLASLSLADSKRPSMVVNVFRHGARGPISAQFSSGWREEDYGLLTPVGMRMHYILGASLAKTYPHLLNKPYDPSRIYVRSSAVLRCFQSVTSQLFGVFGQRKLADMSALLQSKALPPADKQLLTEIVNELNTKTYTPSSFTKANIVIVPEEDDIVLKTPETCPKLMAAAAVQFITPESLIFNHKFSDPAQDAAKKVGVKVDNTIELAKLVDSMYSNEFGGSAQPGQLKFDSQTGRDLIFVRDWYFVKAQYDSDKQRQLLSVPLFEEIIRFLNEKAAGKTQTEFVFLSTHDITVMTILTALRIVTTDCLTENYHAQRAGKPLVKPTCVIPTFAANIIFEFYDEDNGSKSVALKYNGLPVPLCNGQARCEFGQFKKVIADATNNYTSKDYKKTCMNDLKNDVVDKFKDVKNFFKGKKAPTKEEALKSFNDSLVQQREDVINKLFAK